MIRTIPCWLLLAAAPAFGTPLLDPAFSGDGKTTFLFDEAPSKRDLGVGVFRTDDEAYLGLAEIDIAVANPAVVGIGLLKVDTNGALVAGFAGGGKRVKDAGLTSVTDGWLTFIDGLLVAGAVGNDSALVRFHENGSDDTSFAGDGGVVWDASGIGEPDSPQAVAEVDSTYFVAGEYDAAPGGAANYNVWLGTVHESTGALDVFLREDIGLAGDHVVDIEPGNSSSFAPTTLVLLAENASFDAGTLIVVDTETHARVHTLTLENLLGAGTGCFPLYFDMQSTDLVALSTRYHAVVGNLRASGLPRQPFVIVVDTIDGQIKSTRCGPELEGYPSVQGGRADYEGRDLHLAMTIDGVPGYWRWRGAVDSVGLYFRPDPIYNGGLPFKVTFPTAAGSTGIGSGEAVQVDDDGRGLVLGSWRYRLDSGAGVNDYDVALFRVHASETLHADGFEEPEF